MILNLSYRGDLELDRRDARRLASRRPTHLLRNGAADLRLWDGTTFHLHKPERSGRSADQPTRASMRP